MAIDITGMRSRRALLFGAAGGIAGIAAQALGRPQAARAFDPPPYVELGAENTATTPTVVSSDPGRAFIGFGGGQTGIGVTGRSDEGHGVYGESDTWIGVQGDGPVRGVVGHSPEGIGVEATSDSGIALATRCFAGYALQTAGRVRLGSVSGVATIRAGSVSRTVTLEVPVTTRSFVLLTPHVDIGSRRLWFTKNTTARTIRIRMSSPRSTPTMVSWLMLG